MVFSSHLFVFYFLPLVLAFYYLLPRRGRHLGLTLASYVFYGWSNPAFTVLMATSTVVDYCLWTGHCRSVSGRLVIAGSNRLTKGSPRTQQQRVAVAVSVIANLSLLGFFKYFNFGIDTYNALVTALGLEPPRPRLRAADRAAARHQLLHLPVDELLDRRLSGRRSLSAQLRRLRLLRVDVPAARRRADHPLLARSKISCERAATPWRSSRAASASSVLAWPRRCCWPIPAARWPTRSSTQGRCCRSTPGTGRSPTPFRSTSTSPATRTWRSASG